MSGLDPLLITSSWLFRAMNSVLLLAPEQKPVYIHEILWMPIHCTGKELKESFYYFPSSSSSHQPTKRPTECHHYWNTFDWQCLAPIQSRCHRTWWVNYHQWAQAWWTERHSETHRRTLNIQVSKSSLMWVSLYTITNSFKTQFPLPKIYYTAKQKDYFNQSQTQRQFLLQKHS